MQRTVIRTALRAAAASLSLALGAAAPRPAATTPRPAMTPAAPSASTKDFRIETDQTNSNLNNGDFTMPHRVKFFRPGTDVVGDSAKGNFKAGTVTITGHVVLHDNGQTSEAQSAGAPSGGGPSTLECDELQVDSKRKIYIAAGNVRYTQGTRHATADNGRLDQGMHLLDLTGNVHIGDGEQTLTAQMVHYNTLTKDVSTSGSPVIFTQPAGRSLPGTGSTLPPPASTLPTPHSTLPTPHSTLPSPAAKATPKPK